MFKKQFGKRIANTFMDTSFTALEIYILDFYECFNQNLSEHNVKSLMEGFLGADHTNFSSLIAIPLNFSCEHWELLWYHVFGKLFDFKPALINCA